MRSSAQVGLGSLLTAMLWVGLSHAQGAAPGVDPTPAGSAAAPAEAPPEAAPAENGKPAAEGTATDATVADAEAGSSPVELPHQTYRFIGARYRAIVVPKFMMNLFGDGGTTVVVHSGGPEFIIRKDGFEYGFAATFANYAMDPTPFKASSDGEDAWEITESKLKILYLTTDFLWSTEFSPEFALNYGLGAGFGVVFGDLKRVQAYKDASGNYVPCVGKGSPATPTNYCGDDNDHYGDYTEPSWADGGSKPVVFPWLALQTGVRFKPAKTFASRIDLGFGTSGFFAGLGLDYGL